MTLAGDPFGAAAPTLRCAFAPAPIGERSGTRARLGGGPIVAAGSWPAVRRSARCDSPGGRFA